MTEKTNSTLKCDEKKLQTTTIMINTIASYEVLNQIETAVLLHLHECKSISGFLTNSESWNLNKGEVESLERAEIQAIKQLFNLPIHTPTIAILHTFGLLYTKQRVDKRQLIYLHRILIREDADSTKKAIMTLKTLNIGWTKNILNVLESHQLPTDFNEIKNISINEWRRKVENAIEKTNKERLLEDCHKKQAGVMTPKTKTASLIEKIKDPAYKRSPEHEIQKMTKLEAKTLIIARYGMLECGKNFGGTHGGECSECNTYDDENHRLNDCKKWKELNYLGEDEKVDFELVHSRDICILRNLFGKLNKVWNTKNTPGFMNST